MKKIVISLELFKWFNTLTELDLSWSNISQSALENIVMCFKENSFVCKLKFLNLTGTCAQPSMIK